MRAGRLNQRLSLQTRTESRDANGGVTVTWTTTATVWGSMDPVGANERMKSGRVDTIATHKIHLRYYDGLLPTQRLLLGSRVFNLVEVLDYHEAKREHVLLVKEDVA